MRNTPLLKSVLQVLTDSKRPLSVPSIQEALEVKNIHPNKTTLYRMLEKLSESGQVDALLLDPKITYYELKTHHHHHFSCTDCGVIKCIKDQELEKNIHALEEKLASKGLQVNHHHFSLSGTCSTCK